MLNKNSALSIFTLQTLKKILVKPSTGFNVAKPYLDKYYGAFAVNSGRSNEFGQFEN
jgi:hypothetical protein